MEQVLTVLEQYNTYILIGLIVLFLITFILLLVVVGKFNKVQRRYKALMVKEDGDLDSLLLDYVQQVNKVNTTQVELRDKVQELEDKVQYCTQKVGVVRYDAYDKGGADLSFAIAFLDASDNGVVINGIYSRDGSYTYAKPIEKGTSKHNLSEEEIEAIQKAQQKR